jgi:hypothetical protein
VYLDWHVQLTGRYEIQRGEAMLATVMAVHTSVNTRPTA